MHVVDDVKGIDINAGQPLHHIHILLHDLIIVEVLGGDGTVLGADLMAVHLIHAAVDGVQQALGQVGAGAEELHLLADTHGGYAAGNAVVIAVNGTHDIIVLVLDGRVLNGDLGTILLPVGGQVVAPQNGEVGLGGSTQVIQGVQIAVAHLGDHVTAIGAHTAQALGDPGGIAGEDVVVIGGTGKLDQTQLHNKVVYKLLDLLFGEDAVAQVALGIDIQEGGGAAQAHGSAVLLLDSSEIGKVNSLNRFLNIRGGLGDIAAVNTRHGFQLFKGTDLLGKLLAVTDHICQHNAGGGRLLELLVLDQAVNAIQGNTAIVADDTAAAIGIGQTGDDMAVAAGTHLGGVGIKYAGIVGLAVGGEELLHLRIQVIAVILAGLLGHADAAVGHEGALKGLIGLEADDGLLLLIQVTGAMAEDGGNDLGIHIQYAAGLAFLLGELQHFVPQGGGIGGRALQEAVITIVGGVVVHDKVTNIDLGFPTAAFEFFPFVTHNFVTSQFIFSYWFGLLLCFMPSWTHFSQDLWTVHRPGLFCHAYCILLLTSCQEFNKSLFRKCIALIPECLYYTILVQFMQAANRQNCKEKRHAFYTYRQRAYYFAAGFITKELSCGIISL